MRLNIRSVFALPVCAILAACGKDSTHERANTSASPQTAPATLPKSPIPTDASCPANGLWAVCSVEKRLKQSGFVAQKSDSLGEKRAGFTVEPVAYRLNKSRLELYLYDDAGSLAREIPKIDTSAIAPVFIRSGNLIALLFTDDGTQAERLSLALTAGAPQK